MSSLESNQTITFNSDRGNDIFKEGEVIRIKIDPKSAPLVNVKDSYLMFSLLLGSSNDALAQKDKSNGGFVVPDELVGACGVFSSIQILDGNEATILEQLDACPQFVAMKNRYCNDVNDDNLTAIFEGRTTEINGEYYSNANEVPTSAAPQWNSRGGGFGSMYYKIVAGTEGAQRKVQVIYRFPQSGLLSVRRNSVLPVVMLDGLVLKLTLNRGVNFLKLQQVKHLQDGVNVNQGVLIGYGSILSNGDQTVGVQTGAFVPTDECYTSIAAILGATAIKLNKTGGDFYSLTSIENLSITIGSKLLTTDVSGGDNSAKVMTPILGTSGNPVQVIGITENAGDFELTLNEGLLGVLAQDQPIVVDIKSIKTHYEVSDVEMVCNVVDIGRDRLNAMMAGTKEITNATYTNLRVNLTQGALQNEINPHIDLSACMSVFAVNQPLLAENIWSSNLSPVSQGMRSYIWIYDGKNVPNIPVDLTRFSQGLISPLAQIELEKALSESNIRLKNLINPYEHLVIGRRLGTDGRTVSLVDKNLRLRLNMNSYPVDGSGNQIPLLMNFFVHNITKIRFEGNMRVVDV